MHVMEDCVRYIRDLISSKIKDNNRAKSTIANPHLKTCISHPIHLEVYKLGLVRNELLRSKERTNTGAKNFQFELRSLQRCSSVFGIGNIIQMKPKGDVLLACPWMALNKDIPITVNDSESFTLQKGRLAIPLQSNEENGKVTVFIPSGGRGDDCEPIFGLISIQDLFIDSLLPIDLIPLPDKLTDVKIDVRFETFNAPLGEIKEGDIVSISNDRYIVDNVGPDCFKPWMDHVSIGKHNRFKRNNKKRPLYFGSIPKVMGKVLEVEFNCLQSLNPVSVEFKKQGKFNHGTLTVSYKNAIFNSRGFMIHDVAVMLN